MKRNQMKCFAVAVSGFLFLTLMSAASANEKLKVFILAGQSNTVGHARGHTIATLYKSGNPSDKQLIQYVFNADGTIEERFDEQMNRAKEIDALSGGISMDKIKQMAPGAEKTALEAKVNNLLDAHKAYKSAIINACTVSDRVYISSIADRNVKAGKLGVGYGADNEKIGPEYGFGLSIAEKVEGPILLIKSSWGGKSLTYDFRPPSAPDFKTTKAYAGMKESAEKNLLRYEEAVRNFSEAEKKYAADLARYEDALSTAEQGRLKDVGVSVSGALTADEKAKKKLRAPRKPKLPRKPKPFNMDDAGHYWREMVKHVNEVLAEPGKYHPDYAAAQGFEIAGFVWFQGYNDQFNAEFSGNYTKNMQTFIKDARSTFKAPEMPFVIGVLGTGMTKEKVDENQVSQAQRAAAQVEELQNTVRAVESYTQYSHYSYNVFQKGWAEHYHEWDTVGSDRPYHYLGSGAFFVRLGNSFAAAMAELMDKRR